MPIPACEGHTGCLPPTPRFHAATDQELHERYVAQVQSSTTRLAIYQAFAEHATAWRKLIATESVEQWVNGSFVTAKQDPRDIDTIAWFPAEVEDDSPELWSQLRALFPGGHVPPDMLIHAYFGVVYPDGHPKKEWEEETRDYWIEKAFGRIQETGQPKGIIRLVTGGANWSLWRRGLSTR